jgi:hypothetical protein
MNRTGIVTSGLVLLSKADARPVTKADIETTLRQVQSQLAGAQQAATGARGKAAIAGVAVAVVVVAYVFGRRRGARSRAVVEIRRV